MRKFSVLIGMLLTACSSDLAVHEVSLYHEDGRAKPKLSVVSMIDTTSFDCPWSLSEEMTSLVVGRLAETGKIFVQTNMEFPFTENPFGNDLSWVKREFENQEFVAFLELVEHETSPINRGKELTYYTPQETATNLQMAVRVRVLDLRGSAPKIVLQEMIRDSYFVPKTLIPVDYNAVVWGSNEYQNTPFGMAHRQIVKQIAARISDYVILAKSR
jgi:hypothetical protein